MAAVLIAINVEIRVIRVFLTLLGLTWAAISLHELGHVVFGKKQNFKFLYFISGPVEVTRNGDRLQVKENKNWLYFFGISMLMPSEKNPNRLKSKWLKVALGGPIVSLFVCLLSLLIYFLANIPTFLVFSIINGSITVFTLIPFNNGMRSDGYIVKTLSKEGLESEQLIHQLLIINETMSPETPDKWDDGVYKIGRKQPAVIENISSALFIYYKAFNESGFQAAYEAVVPFLNIPVTNKNRHQIGFLINSRQMNLFLNKDGSGEEIRHLQKHLTSIEPFSYYRGLAIIDCLDGNPHAAIEKVNKIYSIIDTSQNRFGFYQEEKKLTKLIEEKINLSTDQTVTQVNMNNAEKAHY